MIYDRCITSLRQILTQIVSETGSLTEESTHAERGAFGNISTRRDIPKKLLLFPLLVRAPPVLEEVRSESQGCRVHTLSIPEVSHTRTHKDQTFGRNEFRLSLPRLRHFFFERSFASDGRVYGTISTR